MLLLLCFPCLYECVCPHAGCCLLLLSQIFAGGLTLCFGLVVSTLTVNTSGPVLCVLLDSGPLNPEKRV